MPSVTLDKLWIHDDDDHADYIAVYADVERSSVQIPGEVRRYAGGRRRLVRRPGRDATLPVTCELVDRTDIDQLEAWAGTTVMVREPMGRVWWAVYLSVDVDETQAGIDGATVNLLFVEVSGSAEV